MLSSSSAFLITNSDKIKSSYFAYFHSTMMYGIIFWEIHPTVKEYLLYARKSLEL
jgi:hypothetical protein